MTDETHGAWIGHMPLFLKEGDRGAKSQGIFSISGLQPLTVRTMEQSKGFVSSGALAVSDEEMCQCRQATVGWHGDVLGPAASRGALKRAGEVPAEMSRRARGRERLLPHEGFTDSARGGVDPSRREVKRLEDLGFVRQRFLKSLHWRGEGDDQRTEVGKPLF